MSHSPSKQQDHQEHQEEDKWLSLTNDILSLILKRLHTQPDLCRFRSTCQTWRNFATPLHSHLLFPLLLPPFNPNSRPFTLSPTFIYLFTPVITTPHPPRHWLVKVTERGEKRWDLLNPLTKHRLYFSPVVKKNGLDLMGFSSCEVGRSYNLKLVSGLGENCGNFGGFDFEEFSSSISVKKVVVRVSLEGGENKVTVLGIFNSGEIGVWRIGDEKWGVVGKEECDGYDDVICFDGRFFAVGRKGRVVEVNVGRLEVEEVVGGMGDEEVYNGMYSYLVEANFRLYLVNKVMRTGSMNCMKYDEEEEEWVVDKSVLGKPLGFNVFVLDERGKRWEKVRSVGGKVLFVSRDVAFSVGAEELGWSKGDCVYFEGLTGYDDEADMGFGLNAGVYNMEDQVITTFGSGVDRWTEIFWPPSSWFERSCDRYPEYEMQG